MAATGPITTHVLNTATGRPADGLQVHLKKKEALGVGPAPFKTQS